MTPETARHRHVLLLCACRTLDALSFFSRIPCSTASDADEWARSLPFFFPAALLFSAVLFLLPVASCLLGLSPPFAPFLAGFLWLASEMWLSRGLHWDGLCDVGDALGSGKEGSGFWTVLHDSRVGAFGVMVLVTVLLGQWLCASAHFFAGAWPVLLFAPAWARSVPIWLARGGSPHPSSSLGRFVCDALTKPTEIAYGVLFFLLPALLAVFYRPSFLLLIPLQYVLLRRLRLLVHKCGGLSGDFFGASIELSQLLFLLLAL